MSYEDQQKAQHPDLICASALPEVQSYQLAGRNARKMLKQAFPGVKFGVSGTSTGNGDVKKLRVCWAALPNAPQKAQVQALLVPFASCTSTFNLDSQAFRRAFGEVTFLDLVLTNPTMEEGERYLKQQLPKAPKVVRPRM